MCIATRALEAGMITWFEPPATDIGAARSFYARALETFLTGGAGLASGEASSTASVGDTIVYRAVPNITAAIALSTEAGGRALTDIIDLPAGIGRIVHMLDANGGRIGLHQPGSWT